MSSQPIVTLAVIGIDNSNVIGSSSGNDRKLAKSNFTKPIYRTEKPSFLTFNTSQALNQLKQTFA